jgi:16S rRNA (guanine966-N2)-methyltransferase
VSIRVIAGTLKRRTLRTPRGLATRPTAARAREALFSILGDLSGQRVLDLYAGSGALGIEALSRGAERALFVESDRGAVDCIRQNIAELELEARASVLPLRVERAPLASVAASGPFDLVFCDPPWADLEQAVAGLNLLRASFAEDARAVLEHPRGRLFELEGFACDDRRHWGDTGVSFYSRPAP